jgi:hypothetical protein
MRSRLAERKSPRQFGSLVLLLMFVVLACGVALAKGGTNMHEPLPVTRAAMLPTHQFSLPTGGFEGCGRGRYRDPRNHRCHGPADFGN